MNELQAEKLRDIITFIEKETGKSPRVFAFNDSVINDNIEVSFRVTIPKEGNLT